MCWNFSALSLSSIAGQQTYPGGNVYCATKAAVKSISQGLKQDLLGTPIRRRSVFATHSLKPSLSEASTLT